MANRTGLALMTIVAGVVLFLVSCGDGNGEQEPGLSRADVEAIVRAELAKAPVATPEAEAGLTVEDVEGIVRAELAKVPAPAAALTEADVEEAVRRTMAEAPRTEPGLSSNEVEEMVGAALAAIPEPEPGLTAAEAERIARGAVASIPPKSAPADYTRFFVENAIARYQTQGLDATLDHYNRAESVDGQWYVFIIDEKDIVVGHPDPERLGLDLKGWVGTDANGYEFGKHMLSATGDGKWVSYVYRNPESGGIGADYEDLDLKNVWVVRHDGLLFASGWYIDADEFTRQLVSIAVDKYRELGLAGTMAYFASPGSALAGLEETIAYYNSAETVDGQWFAFIGDPRGKIVGHSDISMIGRDTQEIFGAEDWEAHEEGAWVESETLRVWLAGYDGFLFGSGWRREP